MLLDPTRTVASLATALPHALPVLERHRIDYCCGGNRSLDTACRTAGLSIDVLAAEIEAAVPAVDPEIDWTLRPLDQLIAHLEQRYHRPLDEALPRMAFLARKVANVHGPKGGRFALEELAAEVEALVAELVEHMRSEEDVVFPWIRGGRRESAGASIRLLTEEHESVGAGLQRIRALADDFVVPEEACGSWRALWLGLADLEQELHAHIHLENNVLFPRALA